MTSSRFVVRIRVIALACGLCALVIVGRLYVLQLMHGDMYAARADAQVTPQATPILDRNAIYFTDKDGNPWTAALMTDAGSTTLSGGEEGEYKRFYPGGALAAQEIGFVAYNNDNVQKGRYGLERYYDQILTRPAENLYANFFVELFGAARAVLNGEEASGSIVTSIEPGVQAELERTLAAYGADWNPALAGGIVMNPQNGEILAMGVYPTFDLNAFNTQEDIGIFSNPLVENVYEMGSIIKPLTVAAGLDAGAITPASTYNDTGCMEVDKKRFCNFDLRARGVIPVQEILSQSLNVGAAFVATRLGPERMRDYFLDRYKLGQETGIDLPGEVHGLVDNLKSGASGVEYDTASFGQGMAITPIATVRALATLANGGRMVTPHLARAVRYDTGVTRALTWGQESEPALNPQTTTDVSRMLTQVVDTALANGDLKLEHYSVAAKTGTAQIANPGGGGYYTDRFLHSFFGYFPSYDAKFIVFLFAVEPKGAPFSSQTWAQPFHSLTKFLISYYDVPPDR